MARKRKRDTKVYSRERGGVTRYYGDFRAYAKQGGSREALIADGDTQATSDPDVAAKLYADRITQLDRKRRLKDLHGIEKQETLKPYAAYHLMQKARDREVTERWLEEAQRHLESAVEFFGADTDLGSIHSDDCTKWTNHLRGKENRKGGTLAEGSVRKYLNSLSNLYARAVSERYVDRNPIADMYTKPKETRTEASFLQAHEAALLLESARTFRPRVEDGGYPWIYPLLATFMLTGARKSEVLGLEVDDVSLKHRKIYLRPNDWRRLKTKGSKRTVPLHPQLEEILRDYLIRREQEGGLGALLFPSGRTKHEQMLTDLRKSLDAIAVRAQFPKGSVRLQGLRHTYTAARLQTCDRGRPVSVYSVARELGHSSTTQIEDRYGHLHDRAEEGGNEVVEFRVDNHRAALKERLAAMEATNSGGPNPA